MCFYLVPPDSLVPDPWFFLSRTVQNTVLPDAADRPDAARQAPDPRACSRRPAVRDGASAGGPEVRRSRTLTVAEEQREEPRRHAEVH